jgi:hypothetical protein
VNSQEISVASSSIDRDKRRILLDALRGGADIRTASHYAGLNYTIVFRVMEIGQTLAEAGRELNPDESAAVELWDQTRKARADAIVRNVAQVQKAAQQGEWKAAAWFLERTLPDVFRND